jgi:hypothetical protein
LSQKQFFPFSFFLHGSWFFIRVYAMKHDKPSNGQKSLSFFQPQILVQYEELSIPAIRRLPFLPLGRVSINVVVTLSGSKGQLNTVVDIEANNLV